jgi:predicted type IV restriction endonuclease
MLQELNKIDIAKIQLDRAIELFLTHNDYVSAITLAGAAEEILGIVLKNSFPEENTSLEDHIFGTQIMVKARGSNPKEYEKKAIVSLLNFYRDHLKHYKEDTTLTFDSSVAASFLIERAITNYTRINCQETPNMLRFKEAKYGIGRE